MVYAKSHAKVKFRMGLDRSTSESVDDTSGTDVIGASKEPELEVSAGFSASMLWLLAIVYPTWSIYLYFFQPLEYDEPLGRVLVALLALVFWTLVRLKPSLKKYYSYFSLVALLTMTSHFYWLSYRNSLSDIYIAGSAVVAAATGVMFDRIKLFVIYSIIIVGESLLVAGLLFHQTPKASMFFVMILTIQLVTYFALKTRMEAINNLKIAREANLEMRKQILEKELDDVRKESAHFRQMSLQDAVTGLPNRYYLERQIHLALDRFFQEGISFTLLFIDLDKFKAVNDTHGHQAGDKVLVAVAQRLRAVLRKADVLARQGGDEFMVILSAVDSEEFIERIKETIQKVLSEPINVSGIECKIGASVGSAVCPKDGKDFESIIQFADQKMYELKKNRSR